MARHFSFEGEILEKGIQKICPVCSSKWTVYNLQNHTIDSFLCMKCGSVFTFFNLILKRGESKTCARCGSTKTHYIIKKGIHKCTQCKYEFP